MPELPDIEAYVHHIRLRLVGRQLSGLQLRSPFLLRSVEPAPDSFIGDKLEEVSRLGKRILFHFPEERFQVLHLMVAGRLSLVDKPKVAPSKRYDLAAWHFEGQSLVLREASKKKRASLHCVGEKAGLKPHTRAGLEPLKVRKGAFLKALGGSGRTLKRFLTDPNLMSGIGNSYSDEILHAARLSPFMRANGLSPEQAEALLVSIRKVLRRFSAQILKDAGDEFPQKVTAFRDDMAVHGRYGKPCPVCDTPVQRVRFADNEMNYCPRCQTGGKIYKDRSLSKLLKGDWPRTIEELEAGPKASRVGGKANLVRHRES